LNDPQGLAFDSVGDLFVATSVGNIYEFTPGGAETTFATGLTIPTFLAFGPVPVPEPSALGLLAVGAIALLVRRRRNLAA
jgi:hypothetical protein